MRTIGPRARRGLFGAALTAGGLLGAGEAGAQTATGTASASAQATIAQITQQQNAVNQNSANQAMQALIAQQQVAADQAQYQQKTNPVSDEALRRNGLADQQGNTSLLGGIIQQDTNRDDPYGALASLRDSGAGFSTASGVTGTSVGSRSFVGTGGADAHYNFGHTFQLASDQNLYLGGIFQYTGTHTVYDFGGGTLNKDQYGIGLVGRYEIGASYVQAGVAPTWGDGKIFNGFVGSTGMYNTIGTVAGVRVGHVFTLTGDASPPPVDPNHIKGPLPTPAPAIKVDLSGHMGYVWQRLGGYTDSTGFVFGRESMSFGMIGGEAKLFADLPADRYTITPYVTAGIDQEFAYSDILNIPTTAAQVGDTVFFGRAQTIFTTRFGLDITDKSGIQVGAGGFFNTSSEYRTIGGQAYIRMPIFKWLGLDGAG